MAKTLTRLLPHLAAAAASAEAELAVTDPIALAGNPHASDSALEELSRHRSYRVRVGVALNSRTPGHVRALLLEDKSARVRKAAEGSLSAHLAVQHGGVAGVLAAAGPRFIGNAGTHEYEAAVSTYGQDTVDDRMLRNATTWDEVVDYVLNRRNNYESQAAIAHYCRTHGEVLRDIQGRLQDRSLGEDWLSRQLSAAITTDPAQLQGYLADTDTDVVTQALLNPLCTPAMAAGALRKGVLPLKTISHVLLVRLTAYPDGADILSGLLDLEVEAVAAAVLASPEFPDTFVAKATTVATLSREPWLREIAAMHPELNKEAKETLARDDDGRVRARLAQRDDLDPATAIDLVSAAVDSNTPVPFEVIRYIPDEQLGTIPWRVLTYPRAQSPYPADEHHTGRTLPAADEGIARVTRYAAAHMDALPPHAFHTISALDAEFNGTIDQMLLAALL